MRRYFAENSRVPPVQKSGLRSGCHVNPAVTLGLFLSKKLRGAHVVGYWIAQCLGAVVAAAVLLTIAKGAPGGYDSAATGLGANGFGAHSPAGYGLVAAFCCEMTLTAFLVFTVLGSTGVLAPVGFAGLPIGFVLAMIHLVSTPVTNTSVNPARILGPALFVGGWELGQLWLFIVGPFAGAGIASLIYNAIGRVPVTDLQQHTALDGEITARVLCTAQLSAPPRRKLSYLFEQHRATNAP